MFEDKTTRSQRMAGVGAVRITAAEKVSVYIAALPLIWVLAHLVASPFVT